MMLQLGFQGIFFLSLHVCGSSERVGSCFSVARGTHILVFGGARDAAMGPVPHLPDKRLADAKTCSGLGTQA